MPLRGISLGQLKHAARCEHAAICTTWPGCLAAGCEATISAVDANYSGKMVNNVCKNKQGPSSLDEPMLYSHLEISTEV